MADVCAVCLDPPIRTRYLPWFICTWIPSNEAVMRYCECQIWVHPGCMRRVLENRASNCIYCNRLYVRQRGTLGRKEIARSIGQAGLNMATCLCLVYVLLWGLHKISGSCWATTETAAALARLWYTYIAVGTVLTCLRSDGGGREIPVDVLAPATAALVLYLVHGSAWLTAHDNWLFTHFCVLCVTSMCLTYKERRKWWFYHPNEISWG